MNSKTTLLEARDLNIHIGDKPICTDLKMTFKAGEVWGILGRNGSGKTTLLHTLAGLRSPTSGEILVKQKKITDYARRQLARQLGILLQNNQSTFPSTVLESALCGRHPHIRRLQWESARDIEITRQALKDVDMQSLIKRSTQTLSGGEYQRLSIATLLAQQTGINLLDEPEAALDLHYQIKLLEHFQSLAKQQNKLVIMCIHDINLAARFCSHFLMLYANGQFTTGKKEDALTEDKLQMVYQHPFDLVLTKNRKIFIPA